MKKGFTMIELIFVIVILGVLAAVAIPKLNATRDDAEQAKAMTNLATLMGDLTSYYTAQGTFAEKISSMTNVPVGAEVGKRDYTAKETLALALEKNSMTENKFNDCATKLANEKFAETTPALKDSATPEETKAHNEAVAKTCYIEDKDTYNKVLTDREALAKRGVLASANYSIKKVDCLNFELSDVGVTTKILNYDGICKKVIDLSKAILGIDKNKTIVTIATTVSENDATKTNKGLVTIGGSGVKF